ncbi:glycosyltransferase family 2 protein [Sporosarcina sp. BI001-red]|uniref:glycosyltransferase family 2 protein n=1 Tax=Sporosarcina sp. BI001-red TaxID=2282866 RepID=UPI001315013A|nr:glycosyltransferase family 2 protein [Sporosarcina sp. BI001-red]
MFSIILPTLGTRETELKRLLDSILDQQDVQLEIIIIAQGNFKKVRSLLNEYINRLTIQLIETNEKGLSKARNEGLHHVQNESILVFTDDDCWYPPGIFKKIENKILSSDISTFQIADPERNKLFKQYPELQSRHRSIFRSFKVSSIEIFINTKKVDKKDLMFDENFGLGAMYPSGEENNLLLDLMEAGYSITYYPEVVVYHPTTEKAFSSDNLYVKGAFFRRNFNLLLSFFLGMAFFLKKLHLVDRKLDGFLALMRGTLSYRSGGEIHEEITLPGGEKRGS